MGVDDKDNELRHWEPLLAGLAQQEAQCDGDGAHDGAHLRRVWRNAQAILADHPEAERLVVLAACYLHDLVNLPKDHPERAAASRRSAELARVRLGELGFPAALLDGVAHAIAAHSFSAAITPTTIEACIVQDADRLDALGAVGLARLFYVAGSMGSALAHGDDPLATQRPLDDRRYALDHIGVKLLKLPETMRTAAGRRLADERVGRLVEFRAAFADEWRGH